MTSTMRSSLLFAATALGVVLSTPAFAQASADEDPGAIVVTARRVEERLQDVPISITVYNQQQLDNRNVTTATELATYTPSLASNNRFGADKASFSIRGFSMLETTAPTVGVYFADVTALRATAGTASGNGAGPGSFFDLQNVQVLKGPQGTLFGRNTTGGAILLVPTKPTDRLEGYVEATAGNYNLLRGQGVLNVPLSDTFRVRLGVDRQKRDGYLHNKSGVGPKDFADSNYFAGRLSIVGDLTPDLENYLIARYSRSHTHGFMLHMVGCNTTAAAAARGSDTTPPVLSRLNLFALAGCEQLARQAARGDGFYDVENSVPGAFNQTEEWQVSNTTTWKASDTLTIKNIASYGEFRERFWSNIGGDNLFDLKGPAPTLSFTSTTVKNLPGRYAAAQSTFSEELQFQGNNGALTWQAGGYLEISKPLSGGNTTFSQGGLYCADVTQLQCTPSVRAQAGPSLGLVQNLVEFRNIGFYAQGTYKLSDQFSVTGGIRYTIDRTIGSGGRVAVSYANPAAPRGVCAHPAKATVLTFNPLDCAVGRFVQKSKEPTWLIDLDYKPIPDVLIYAKWARGYRQGGVNPSNIGIETWTPEKVDTYEGGLKASFGGAVHGFVNLAAFYNDFRNQQLQAIAVGCSPALCPGRPVGPPGARVILNAGKSRIYGLEADASVTLLEGFRVDLGYAYLKTKLLSVTVPPLDPNGPFFSITGPLQGGPLPLSPKHRLTLTATYNLPVDESIGDVSISGTWTYTSKQVANDTIPPQFGILPSSNLFNANLNWNKVAGSPVDLAVFVTNLTNEKFPVNVAGNWNSTGFESIVPNVPRMWGVRLRYSFGN
jgi:iron complex outermembrane receptor protein